MSRKQVSKIFIVILYAISVWFALPASADQDDPPTRVARLSYTQGSVSFQPAGTDDWVTPGINRPMTMGDKMWADNDGSVELQLDDSVIRMSHNTGFSFLNLNDNVTQVQLTAGTLFVRVRRLDQNETYEIDTPNLAFSILRPGFYRIEVNENGDQTGIAVRSGEGEVTGGGNAYSIHPNDSYVFSGTEQLYANRQDIGQGDELEAWAMNRDRRWESSRSSRYVPEGVIGYEDLDQYGSWRQVPDYGDCWFPHVSAADWAPYHYGHWDYIEPWGYTWVDDQPWGFAPFHYGRWAYIQGSWGWVPAPRHVEGIAYARPVYAPALVAWVGGGVAGASVAWFPLGPREVYVPSYRVSQSYVQRVNVTNTTVNTTVVNNYYNTTIVNNNTNVTNVKYVNRAAPGAIAATTQQAFTGAQPIARNRVQVDTRAAASAPVRAVAPPVTPVKQSVLGSAGPAAAKPPAAVQARTVIAKAAPPPPPPSFEKRQAAIQSNGGKPLSAAQMRQIAPAAAQPHPEVRVAPAAKPAATPPPPPPNRATQPSNPPPGAKSAPNTPPSATPPANRPPTATPPPAKPTQPPPSQPPTRPNEKPAPQPKPNNPPSPPPRTDRPPTTTPPQPNPSEKTPPPRPATPPSGNPAIEQQHQQQQEQLRQRQAQEQQRLQQQQEQERRAAQQQANQARQQQLEKQHQQQVQQLQQKHAQEQQQLSRKQQEERQAEEKKKPKQNPPPEPKH